MLQMRSPRYTTCISELPVVSASPWVHARN
jgi:hypothetical protein